MKLTLSEFKRLSLDDQKEYLESGLEILPDEVATLPSAPELPPSGPASLPLMTRADFATQSREVQSAYILAHGTLFLEAPAAFVEDSAKAPGSANEEPIGCLMIGLCILIPITGPVYCLITVADPKKRQAGLTGLAISIVAALLWIALL
jgi:hypothetical protein